jgi:hypothetical protein
MEATEAPAPAALRLVDVGRLDVSATVWARPLSPTPVGARRRGAADVARPARREVREGPRRGRRARGPARAAAARGRAGAARRGRRRPQAAQAEAARPRGEAPPRERDRRGARPDGRRVGHVACRQPGRRRPGGGARRGRDRDPRDRRGAPGGAGRDHCGPESSTPRCGLAKAHWFWSSFGVWDRRCVRTRPPRKRPSSVASDPAPPAR